MERIQGVHFYVYKSSKILFLASQSFDIYFFVAISLLGDAAKKLFGREQRIQGVTFLCLETLKKTIFETSEVRISTLGLFEVSLFRVLKVLHIL